MVDRPMVDIHCHMLPGLDDGATDLAVSLEMAKMASRDGIETVIATPHQLGHSEIDGDTVRSAVATLQSELDRLQIPLKLLPGGDVRIDDSMVAGLRDGRVMSLADHRKHVLLELPHEIYLPLDGVLASLGGLGMVGILSHPERNRGILNRPEVLRGLVDSGCLMQITAGSLLGSFGQPAQQLSEQMLAAGLVHFVASDGHGVRKRRPMLSKAYARVVELAGLETAQRLCCDNPRRVADGEDIVGGKRIDRRSVWQWFSARRAG